MANAVHAVHVHTCTRILRARSRPAYRTTFQSERHLSHKHQHATSTSMTTTTTPHDDGSGGGVATTTPLTRVWNISARDTHRATSRPESIKAGSAKEEWGRGRGWSLSFTSDLLPLARQFASKALLINHSARGMIRRAYKHTPSHIDCPNIHTATEAVWLANVLTF